MSQDKMTPHDELMALAGELKVAIAEAQHKPGEWHTSVQMMGAAVKREEPSVAGQFLPFNEVAIGKFPYKRDGWLAVKAVNALPAILALLDSDAFRAMARDVWLPIESAPKNRTVLAGYFNKLGKWRTVRATFYAAGTLEAHEDYMDDDADDDGCAPAGWYEECESSECIRFTDEPPTHWRPLPAPPQAIDAAASGAGE